MPTTIRRIAAAALLALPLLPAPAAAQTRETAVLAGEILLEDGSPIRDPARAEALFRRALERDPDHPRAKSRLGLR